MCLFFVASIQADNHTPAEKEVAAAFNTYFEARVDQDWDTVAAMESVTELIIPIRMVAFIKL